MLKKSILIADPQLIFREGLKSILGSEPFFEVIAEADCSENLHKKLATTKPDVIIIDHLSAGHFSMEDIETIQKMHSKSSVLVLTSNQNKTDILKTLEYGVVNYVLKKCGKPELLTAIYAASKKERYMCSSVIDVIVDKHIHVNENAEAVILSPREIEIVQLISEGNTNNSIAKILYLSIHTVSTHRKNILKKFGVKKSSELVMHAIRAGIITPSEL